MNSLTKYLVEGILAEEKQGIVVLLPGGFKPPHGGHLDLAKRYAAAPNVSQVIILVGPEAREGITREISISVWKDLLGGVSNVKVQATSENSPLGAAYKYIENAKPGAYALASSGKGDDYKRVQQFVASHAKGAKYHRASVQVVELPIDSKPILYKGRKDEFNGKGISASVLRKDIQNLDYNNFKTNYPGVSENIVKTIFSKLTKKSSVIASETIMEGGAAGHLAHPYEDYDLTFADIKAMIVAALSGTIESAQEKLDGQNLMVTYKNGQIRAARNKGQVKDEGANSLTIKQMSDMFVGRGPIQTAFVEAMNDLKAAIDGLTTKQKDKFFANGKKFLNLEVLFPETANVVPYGAAQLRLHHIKEYDAAGNVVNEDLESAKQLEGALRQIEAQNQKTYEIRVTDPLTIAKSGDFKNQRDELLKKLNEIKTRFGLKDGDKLGLYFQAWWSQYITNTAKQYGYKLEDNTLQQLINRWAFGNKETNIKVIRDGIQNEDFKNWMTSFDKSDYAAQRKVAGQPVENLFLQLGVYTLQNVQNLVALNPNNSVRKIKQDLQQAIEDIKATASDNISDDSALVFLKRELRRLKDIGGFKAVLPTEGLVFKYQGKLYKLTGAFAPINQILGYLKF